MASIYDLKPRFQALLRPAAGWLAASGITANQVTVAAMLLSLITGALVTAFPSSRGLLLLVTVVLFIRMALNAIDGMLAREFSQRSRLGAILNELGDVVSDAALYLPLALVDGMRPALVVVFVVLAIISEMAGVAAVLIGADRRYDGPLGKSDRAVAVGLICFLMDCGVPRGAWLDVVWLMLVALAAVTIIKRSLKGLQVATSAGSDDT